MDPGKGGLQAYSAQSPKAWIYRAQPIFLNDSLDAVERVEVLAEDDPSFDYPTTGVVVGTDLVFVATSFADVPRNAESARQHPAVLIHRLRLEGSSSPR